MSEHFLDASDLGMSPDAEGYQDFVEDIGSEPPWTLTQLQGYFDRRYAGWDDPPKLSLSSPVRRLQYLDEALRSNDPQSIEETLRVLDEEVKNALLRSLLRDTSSDELCFLTLLVGELGAHLYDEREGRKNDRTEAQRERMMSEDGMMSNFQNEKATLTQQLEELTVEAENHRQEASRLRSQVHTLEAEESQVSEMTIEVEELRSANHRLTVESQRLREELQDQLKGAKLELELCEPFFWGLTKCPKELKAQKAMLLAAKEESDGALDEFSRRFSNSGTGSWISAPEESPLPREKKTRTVRRSEVSHLGRLADDMSEETRLRQCWMAWRMMLLSHKLKKQSSESLQADLSLASGKASHCQVDGCCCRRQAGLFCAANPKWESRNRLRVSLYQGSMLSEDSSAQPRRGSEESA
eukprot:symbB.v1.2.000088.t1/scaffold14.1/size489596/13